MRKRLGFAVAMVLAAVALAGPRPGSASTGVSCLGQCQSSYFTCSHRCNGSGGDCVSICLTQLHSCECTICHLCTNP
jgi:hypothetical protein